VYNELGDLATLPSYTGKMKTFDHSGWNVQAGSHRCVAPAEWFAPHRSTALAASGWAFRDVLLVMLFRGKPRINGSIWDMYISNLEVILVSL
jgi:hypothetical protein